MTLPRTIKIIVAIATLLTGITTLGFAIFALTLPHWGLFATCLLLTAFIGLFVRNDYAYFFGKKTDETKK